MADVMASKPITPEMIAQSGTEAAHQKAIILWAAYNLKLYPELKFLYHIPNGGFRNPREAANLKAMGVRAGVPDLHLPVPKKNYAGLFIELKTNKGKASPEQLEWVDFLRNNHYSVWVCIGWQAAVDVIEQYLKMEKVC